MKAKNWMMAALSLITVAASAEPMNTLLTYTSDNGTVAPQAYRLMTCTISATEVTIETTGPMVDFPHAILKKMKFTAEVPTPLILQSLVEEASHHALQRGIPPVGGGVQIYSAQLTTQKTLTLLEMAEETLIATNPSRAAKRLEALINENCK